MSGFPVVIVASGGIPVTESENGPLATVAERGTPITLVASGGLPLNTSGGVVLPAWLADVKAGTDASTSVYLFIVGDSCTVGSGAGDAGNNVDAHKNSWPVKFSALMAGYGVNARADGWGTAAYGYTVADAEAYRPGIDFATWAIDGRNAMSTRVMRDANIGQGDLSLTPESEFNGLRVWNVLEAVNSVAQFTAAVDGSVEATISGSTSGTPPGLGGVPRQNETVITGLTKKAQQIVLTRVNGDVRPSALVPYNTDESELIAFSVAASGMTTTQATTLTVSGTPKAYTMGNSGTYFPRGPGTLVGSPTFGGYTALYLGINDMLDAVDPTTTFRTNLAALRANHIAASPILWIVPQYIDPVTVATVTQEAFHDEIRAIAASNDDLILDLTEVFGSFATADAAGDMSDDIHPSAQGQDKIAAAVVEAFLAA